MEEGKTQVPEWPALHDKIMANGDEALAAETGLLIPGDKRIEALPLLREPGYLDE